MSVKAMALVCAIFAGGESECKTEFYPRTFDSLPACTAQLIQ